MDKVFASPEEAVADIGDGATLAVGGCGLCGVPIAAAGATGVTVIPLHLRPGAREWFMGWLARAHPELVPRYEQLYARRAYLPAEYRAWLAKRVAPLLARHGLDRQKGGAARKVDGPVTAGVPGDEEVTFPEGSLPATGPAGGPAPSAPGEQLALL